VDDVAAWVRGVGQDAGQEVEGVQGLREPGGQLAPPGAKWYFPIVGETNG
jgi:hypothetical protein